MRASDEETEGRGGERAPARASPPLATASMNVSMPSGGPDAPPGAACCGPYRSRSAAEAAPAGDGAGGSSSTLAASASASSSCSHPCAAPLAGAEGAGVGAEGPEAGEAARGPSFASRISGTNGSGGPPPPPPPRSPPPAEAEQVGGEPAHGKFMGRGGASEVGHKFRRDSPTHIFSETEAAVSAGKDCELVPEPAAQVSDEPEGRHLSCGPCCGGGAHLRISRTRHLEASPSAPRARPLIWLVNEMRGVLGRKLCGAKMSTFSVLSILLCRKRASPARMTIHNCTHRPKQHLPTSPTHAECGEARQGAPPCPHWNRGV